jgi:hypothetical protein
MEQKSQVTATIQPIQARKLCSVSGYILVGGGERELPVLSRVLQHASLINDIESSKRKMPTKSSDARSARSGRRFLSSTRHNRILSHTLQPEIQWVRESKKLVQIY